MGTFFWTPELRSEATRATAVREFNLYTVPAFFRVVQAERGTYDFSIPDQTADFAEHDTALRIHNLIWCNLLPEWVNDQLTGSELEEVLVSHVTAVVAHYESKYPGKTVGYDVVNEPFSYKGNACPWNRIGLESGRDSLYYVHLALRAAREASPTATLCINDFHIEGLGDKSNRMFDLVSELKRNGTPLDCVGLQSHFVIGSDELTGEMPPPEEIAANMDRYATLGVGTIVTEADFAIRDEDVSASFLDAQADAYSGLLGACLASSGCSGFVVWGVHDDDSWIPQTYPGWGSALVFDERGEPKPAYEALLRRLDEAPRIVR